MKIAIISPTLLDTPPKQYGGLERVNYDLTCGLTELGHKIVLFATNESKVPDGAYLMKLGEACGTIETDWVKREIDAYEQYKQYLPEFDAILSSDWFGIPYKAKVKNPELKILHTHHGGLNPEWWNKTQPPFKLNLVAISRWMKQVYAQQGYDSQVAYNPVKLEDYPYKSSKGDRYMFLGRIDNIKTPHLAIQACRQANVPLDVIGATSFVSDQNYVNQIKQMCDGEQIRFIGEVDHKTKVEYLQNARGLVVTSSFGEPFGLMLIEAMSCGTPVYALRDGAIPEIIVENTGVVCDSVDALSKSLQESFYSMSCRKRAEDFSVQKCSKRYEQLIQQVVSGKEWG